MENWYKDLIKNDVFKDILSITSSNDEIVKSCKGVFKYNYIVNYYKRRFENVSFIESNSMRDFLNIYKNTDLNVVSSEHFKLDVGESKDIKTIIAESSTSTSIFDEYDYSDIYTKGADENINTLIRNSYNFYRRINKFLYIGSNLNLPISKFKEENYSYVLFYYDYNLNMFVVFNETYNEVVNKIKDLSYPAYIMNDDLEDMIKRCEPEDVQPTKKMFMKRLFS